MTGLLFLAFNDELAHSETNTLSKKPLLDLYLAGKIKLIQGHYLVAVCGPNL